VDDPGIAVRACGERSGSGRYAVGIVSGAAENMDFPATSGIRTGTIRVLADEITPAQWEGNAMQNNTTSARRFREIHMSTDHHRIASNESRASSESDAGQDFEKRDGDDATTTATVTRSVRPRLDRLPPWRVLLHNDDDSDMLFVVDTIVVLGVTNRDDAISRMLEAHETGCALLTMTHREHAELLEEQFQSKGLTVSIEPA